MKQRTLTHRALISVPQFQQFHRFKVVVIIWLVFASLGDAIITIALVWYLVCYVQHGVQAMNGVLSHTQHKHKTGFSETDATINRIIRREQTSF